jgi:DNA polymerase-3 subunit alpha
MITRYRTHQTRKGQSMAFATLEDLQGEVELVIFPRAWKQVSNQIEIDKLIVAEGRVDPESSEPKLLVDVIKTDITITQPTKKDHTPGYPDLPETESHVEQVGEGQIHSGEIPPQEPEIDHVVLERPEQYPSPKPVAISDQQQEPIPGQAPEDDPAENQPPPPANFPEDFDLTSAVMSAVADPEGAIDLAESAAEIDTQQTPSAPPPESSPSTRIAVTDQDLDADIGKEIGIDPLPAYLVTTPAATDSDKVKMITIILRSSHDKVRDNLRIRQIYGTLITYPGKDRFAFHVFERSHGYLIEFPNFTTRVCPELLSRLKSFIHSDEVRVEDITFQ